MQDNQKQYWGMPLNTYCMLIHLSQLSSIVIPGLGFILPVVMWVVNKDKSDTIDQHGKVTVNWLISLVIYYAICFILVFILIGVVAIWILALLNIVFAIIAALKANIAQLWVYPLSIRYWIRCQLSLKNPKIAWCNVTLKTTLHR